MIELPPEEESPIKIIAIDTTSLQSIIECSTPRSGWLFGAVAEDGFTAVIDAIYEGAQDADTGIPLRDSRLPMVTRTSALMGLKLLGMITTKNSEIQASHLIRSAVSLGIIVTTDEEGLITNGFIINSKCKDYIKSGRVVESTTLKGQTVDGGLDGSGLYNSVPVVKREVNTIVHTGFYRLNRWNHTPTLEDARIFILTRREKANIDKKYQQIADYHLLLFIADSLGESSAERAILAIFQEEDELIEDLMEVLMNSTGIN